MSSAANKSEDALRTGLGRDALPTPARCFISCAHSDHHIREGIAQALGAEQVEICASRYGSSSDLCRAGTDHRADLAPSTGSANAEGRLESRAIEELARVFYEREPAMDLMRRTSFPKTLMPAFETSNVFWGRIVERARAGALRGVRPILEAAATVYPNNPLFEPFSGRDETARASAQTFSHRDEAVIHSSTALALVLSEPAQRADHVLREVECAVLNDTPVHVFRTAPLLPKGNLEYSISLAWWYDGYPTSKHHYERFARQIIEAADEASHRACRLSLDVQERLHSLVRQWVEATAGNARATSLHEILLRADIRALRELAALARRCGDGELASHLRGVSASVRAGRWPQGLSRVGLYASRDQGCTRFRLHASIGGQNVSRDVMMGTSGTEHVEIDHGASLEIEVEASSFRVMIQAHHDSSLRARRISIWNGLRLIQQRLRARATGALGPHDDRIVILEECMELPL
ncbi:MAG: effector-associated domain EAD1-containing protein [Myxococcota bacterium]